MSIFVLLFGACGGSARRSEEAPRTGGSIVVGLSDLGSLDPARASSASDLTLVRTACNGLLGLDQEDGAVKAGLARDWDLSDAGRKLTVTLRSGSKFQDGSAVTSESVREALSRVARPSVSSPWAYLMARVEGFSEVQSGAATHLSGVRALDDMRVEINLSQPFSGIATVLAHPALIPVSLNSLKKSPEGAPIPVCSGPYQIKPGSQQGDLRLSKVAAGDGAADLILVRAFESPEDAYASFGAGQVDIAPVPDSRVGEARPEQGLQSRAVPQLTFLGFDGANPITGDPRVRQAISLAVDRLAIIDAVYGDQRRPATGWLPEKGARPAGSACGKFVRRISDPDQAKQLLLAAGDAAARLELALYYDGNSTRSLAEALKIQIEQGLGIAVVPKPLEGQDVLAHFASKPREPAAWIMTTKIDLGLPDEFLGAGTGGPIDTGDREFNRLIDDARSATSESEIAQRYGQAEARLCDLMPGVPLWTGVSNWMFSPERVDVQADAYLDSLGSPLLRRSFAAGG